MCELSINDINELLHTLGDDSLTLPDKDSGLCQLPHCRTEIYKDDLCKSHFMSFMRCLVNKCELWKYDSGYCAKHSYTNRKCAFNNCTNPKDTYGICKWHYGIIERNLNDTLDTDPLSKISGIIKKINNRCKCLFDRCKNIAESHSKFCWTHRTY
jgi:hypothetical protein